MFSCNLDYHLTYICRNQKCLCAQDAELMGEYHVPDNNNIYLPASFLGSHHWASNQVSDCLTIAAHDGCPTFFITMTCNAEWLEITSQLNIGQDYTDIPLIVIRVYKHKLSLLECALETMFPNSGGQLYCIQSTEFQQCGLPHTHLLLKYQAPCVTPSNINSIISAEIPLDPADAHFVQRFMIHHHQMDDSWPMSKYCQ